jgi:hypothetical protein
LSAPPKSPDPYEEEVNRFRQQIAGLEGQLRERDSEIKRLQGDIHRAFEEGVERGCEQGRGEAEDRQAERLALLEMALGRADIQIRETLSAVGRLAPVLASDCLDILFGEAGSRAGLIEELIRHQVAMIDKTLSLRVELSSADFSSEESLDALAHRLALPVTAFDIRDDFVSGKCAMVLRLGRMEIGIDQQWGSLRDLLTEMALPGGQS